MLLPIAILIFFTVFCLVIAICLAVAHQQDSPKAELKRRLQRMAREGAKNLSEDLKAEITRETKPIDLFFARLPFTRSLDRKLDQAGLNLAVSVFVMITAAGSLTCLGLGILATKSALVGLAIGAGTVALADVFLKVKAQMRAEKFTELFPDALSMIARSLRAGHSFTTSIQLVGQEVPAPVGELFKTAYDQQLLGLRITDGLVNMNDRLESLDLRFFTTVVSINSEIGGNLSDVLEKLAVTIRERLRIRRQVKVFTAQGRMSGYVLGSLPAVAFIIFNFVYYEYESALLKEPMGLYILMLAGSLQIVGLLLIRKIIKIHI